MLSVPIFRACALVVVSSVVLASCGEASRDEAAGDDRAGSRAKAPASTPPEPVGDGSGTQATARLRVKVENVGGKRAGAGIPVPSGISCDKRLPATCSGVVECPAPNGDRLVETCTWLATPRGSEAVTSTPPEGRMCTEQYGGPEVATVTGTLGENTVDAEFSRTDGCAIARFDAASPLWTGSAPEPQPEVIDDPPEAFDR